MGPGHLPSKRVVNAQGRAARTAGGESWGGGVRWEVEAKLQGLGGGCGHWRELHPGMRGGRSPAGRCWAQGSTQLIWTLEEAGTGDWARLSPLPQPRQDGTLIPKCLRSCSRNTNVSTVWGMRRMPAGKRPWVGKGAVENEKSRGGTPAQPPPPRPHPSHNAQTL